MLLLHKIYAKRLMMSYGYKRATIVIDEDEWELFKKLCRKNNSDASKEVRKFIREYIKKHKEEK